MRNVCALWIGLMFPMVTAAGGDCPAREIVPLGAPVETRFFDASVNRTRDAVADAMQAVGVVLYENGARLIRGERRPARVKAMDLPKGDEAVAAFLDAALRDGRQGTSVRVETRRPGGKPGSPDRSWSGVVLGETGCLLGLLVVTDAVMPPPDSAGESEREVALPDGTPLTLLLRHFVFSAELRVNQRLAFESRDDVKVGPDIVIPRGAPAVARVLSAEGAEVWGKGARAAIAFQMVSAVNGFKVPIQGSRNLHGAGAGKLAIGLATVNSWFEPTGRQFAIPAGTPFQVTVEGSQKIRLNSPRLAP